jgi:hypothetical protein
MRDGKQAGSRMSYTTIKAMGVNSNVFPVLPLVSPLSRLLILVVQREEGEGLSFSGFRVRVGDKQAGHLKSSKQAKIHGLLVMAWLARLTRLNYVEIYWW